MKDHTAWDFRMQPLVVLSKVMGVYGSFVGTQKQVAVATKESTVLMM